jgi:hypothetical protein
MVTPVKGSTRRLAICGEYSVGTSEIRVDVLGMEDSIIAGEIATTVVEQLQSLYRELHFNSAAN